MALIKLDVNTNTFSTRATSHVLGIRTHLSHSGSFIIPWHLWLYCFWKQSVVSLLPLFLTSNAQTNSFV